MKSIIKIALGIVLAFFILCFIAFMLDDDDSSSSTSNIAQNVQYDDDDDLDWDLDEWDEVNQLLDELNAMIDNLDSDNGECSSGYGYHGSHHHGGRHNGYYNNYDDDDDDEYYDDDDDEYYDDDDDDEYYDDDDDDDDDDNYYSSNNNSHSDDDDDDNYAPQPTPSHHSSGSSAPSSSSASGKLIDMDLDSFNRNVADLNTDNGTFIGKTPCIVMLWADWCDYCKDKLEPLLEKLAEKFKGQIKFYKLNVDENEAVFNAYGLQSLPTLVLGYGEDIQISTGSPNEDWMKNQIKNMLAH